ncbi:unnamed protein product [Camellia sinensis]
MAETLGVPYLSAYLDSIGTNFSHDANFATGGSSIRPGGYSPFHVGGKDQAPPAKTMKSFEEALTSQGLNEGAFEDNLFGTDGKTTCCC